MSLRYVAIPWMLLASVTPVYARQFVFDLTPGLRAVDGGTSGEFDLGLQFTDIQHVRLDIEATHTPGYMVVSQDTLQRWKEFTEWVYRDGPAPVGTESGGGFYSATDNYASTPSTLASDGAIIPPDSWIRSELPSEWLSISLDGRTGGLGLEGLDLPEPPGRFIAVIKGGPPIQIDP